ncbi:hypothetical protein [Streptomyces sp. LaBMicrA B280]|uniref:hypothetical protein n=1 Tax=Streptomyces sp. LaBMicrA B280 TaxID=3391001 RepID=UPI003BA53821
MDEPEGLEKLRRETEALQREAADATRRLQGLERLAEAARENLAELVDAEMAEPLDLMGLEAKVVRSAPHRLGVACGIREGFVKAGTGVPVLTDEGWGLLAIESKPGDEARSRCPGRRPA